MQDLSPELVRKSLLGYAVVFVCLDALSIQLGKSHPDVASYPFLILAPALSCATSIYRAKTSARRARTGWSLLATALLLWTLGMSLSAWEDMAGQVPGAVAWFSDFSYFLYGAPVLLILSLPAASERLPLFFWLDAIQAALTALLIYIGLFGSLPFLGQPLQPVSTTRLVLTYNIENFILAGVAGFRFFTLSDRGEIRRRYAFLAIFLWIYAFCAGLYNVLFTRVSLQAQQPMGLLDIIPTLPFLLLTIATFALKPIEISKSSTSSNSLELFFDNASPILYSLAVLALGVFNLRRHVYFGVSSIFVAFIIYAIRSAALQSRYIRAQISLREARDLLEAISLQDALTGVANRRCFDQTLAREWNNATRTQLPLSLLLIDVDFFKNLNDRYGHPFGDQCLVKLASALRASLTRSGDLLARYGGEEFAAILIATDRVGAEVVAGRIQTSVRALNIPNETAAGHVVTVSIGISTYQFPQNGLPATLVKAADSALYQAKRDGRDRVEYFSLQTLFDASWPNIGSSSHES